MEELVPAIIIECLCWAAPAIFGGMTISKTINSSYVSDKLTAGLIMFTCMLGWIVLLTIGMWADRTIRETTHLIAYIGIQLIFVVPALYSFAMSAISIVLALEAFMPNRRWGKM